MDFGNFLSPLTRNFYRTFSILIEVECSLKNIELYIHNIYTLLPTI